MIKRCTPFTILMVLILSMTIAGQNQHANQSRGFNPNGVYSSFDIDDVNLFNGNLVVSIPIGQRYPVSGNLSYQFVLVYNSYAWTQREICVNSIDFDTHYYTSYYSSRYQDGRNAGAEHPTSVDAYDPGPSRGPQDGCYTAQYPNPAANAGMGWQLTFGRIYLPFEDLPDVNDRAVTTERRVFVYQAPDGSEHSFYPNLHIGEAITPNVYYSRDGSYLKLTHFNNVFELHFPNGVIHTFGAAPNGLSGQTEQRVVQMRDQFAPNNFVNITYTPTQWTITDSLGRTHTVNLAPQSEGFPNVVSGPNGVVLDTFSESRASYGFTVYTTPIPRAFPHPGDGVVPGFSNTLNAPFLSALTLPDGSQYSIPFSGYDYTGEFSSEMVIGVMRKLVLPTGGSIEWEYRGDSPEDDMVHHYGYPIVSSARNYLRVSTGVRKRIVRDGANKYVWKYRPTAPERLTTGVNGEDCTFPQGTWWYAGCAPKLFINEVIAPKSDGTEGDGDVTRTYFSVYPHPWNGRGRSIYDWHVVEYGLPINKDVWIPDSTSNAQPLFLSTEVFDQAGYTSNPQKPKRSTYVRYETDQWEASDGWGNVAETNARVEATRIVYNDDCGNALPSFCEATASATKFQEVQFSDFDGLGHYRRQETFGNLENSSRVTVTNYNPGVGTYRANLNKNIRDTGFAYTPFSGDYWVLGTYDMTLQSESNKRSITYFKYDAEGKGLLLARRTRKEFDSGANDVLGTHDVLVQYNYDDHGNLAGENYFGGDSDKPGHANLSTATRFPLLDNGNSEYQINYGHQCVRADGTAGVISVVSTTEYRGVDFKTTNDTIDCRTGLVKESLDSAGVKTTYDYDTQGRMKTVTRQEGSTDHIAYVPGGSGGVPPTVTVTRSKKSNVTEPYVATFGEEVYVYDGLGRLVIEKKRERNGVFQVRYTGYNGLGWTTTQSEWVGTQTGGLNNKQTVYENFDPFGRPQRIVLPDYTSGDSGNHHAVLMGYLGVRGSTRTVRVGTQIDGSGKVTEADTTSKETYDAQGRLIEVIEPAGVGGGEITWRYGYDVNGKLISAQATQPGVISTSIPAVTQSRNLTYDNLGNLITAVLPERASQYSNYDTLGHALHSNDGSHQLAYSYDKAGRNLNVQEFEPNIQKWRPLKNFTYTDAPGFGVGKLAKATRYNWISNPYETPANVAPGKVASQSSTVFGATASLAIDGQTSGVFGNNSVTHTDIASQPWWQVDLGANAHYLIDQVRIWNRTDCCADRLSNFYVLVSDQPFVAGDTLEMARLRPGVSSYFFASAGVTPTIVPVGRTGRYVRVQLTGSNYLSLAEVQIYAREELGVPITEEYSYTGRDGRIGKQVTTLNSSLSPANGFEQTFEYDEAGNLLSQTYPQCTHPNCVNTMVGGVGQARPLTVRYDYEQGWLSSVVGATPGLTNNIYASDITYNLNGTIEKIAHGNKVSDNYPQDLNFMSRTSSIQVKNAAGAPLWDSGPYQYDGSGNITKIGADWYLYDKVNRLTEGSAVRVAMKKQYSYDSFGNMLAIKTYNNVSSSGNGTLVDTYSTNAISSNNRFNLNYDAAGNALGLTGVGGQPPPSPLYVYDGMNLIKYAPGFIYLYGPGDERMWMLETGVPNSAAAAPLTASVPVDNTKNQAVDDLPPLSTDILPPADETIMTLPPAMPEEPMTIDPPPGDPGDTTAGNPGSGEITLTSTGDAGDSIMTAPPPPASGEFGWVNDSLPAGAITASDNDQWNWINSNPAPYFGTKAHQSDFYTGLHQHYFYWANGASSMQVNSGDKLIAWIYLTTANLPKEVMLQWNDGTWNHRAYWGENRIALGDNGSPSRFYKGVLPAAGQWIKLEVLASEVGLENRTVTGMAFTLFGGRAVWDYAGKASAGAYEGYHESIDCNNIAGWVWDPAHPGTRLSVTVYDGTTELATGVADLYRPDLVAAGKGDGRYGFGIPVPASIKNGQNHSLRVKVTGTNYSLVWTPKTFNSTTLACPVPISPSYQGSHDLVDCNFIQGWVWDQNSPNTRLGVTVYEGNTVVASGMADQYRQDLVNAGKGDGRYGFFIPTPASLKNGQSHVLTVKVTGTTVSLPGTPRTFNSTTSQCNTSLPPSYGGAFDSVDCAYISGWAWDSNNQNNRLNVTVYDGTTIIASGVANNFRQDLFNAGKGDGRYGFFIATPASIKNGANHNLNVKITGTNFSLGSRSFASTCASYEGAHESVSCTAITGWAWDRNAPAGTRVTVAVSDETGLTVTGIANQYRSELAAQGKGDGYVGFSIPTPAGFKNGQPHTITAKVNNTTFSLTGSPRSFNSVTACSSPAPPQPPPPPPGPPASIVQTITIRGLNHEVLREYQVVGDGVSVGNWRWSKDYIYAGTRLISGESSAGIRHYHLDHLGTPRVVTDGGGNVLANAPYQYFPFGEPTQAAPPADERLRFTGHERDHDNSGLTLDYMHARFYNYQGGKFLSVDPAMDIDPKQPQSWNLYSYVRNNPVNATDPTGAFVFQGVIRTILSIRDRMIYHEPVFKPGKVYVCRRRTHIEGILSPINSVANHFWLRTDQKEGGLGPLGGGVPGQGGPPDSPFVSETSINDHKGESTKPDAVCEIVKGANPAIVNRELQFEKPMGKWTQRNNCYTFVHRVILKAQGFDPDHQPRLVTAF